MDGMVNMLGSGGDAQGLGSLLCYRSSAGVKQMSWQRLSAELLCLVGESEGAVGLLHVREGGRDTGHHSDEAMRLQTLLQHLGEF